MPVKLLFITSVHFYQPTLDALQRMQLPCETLVVPYTSFDQIASVYQQHIDSCDACLVSGTSAKNAIALTFPNPVKPLIPFQVDADGLHRNILRLAMEKQSLDFSRIAIDFLVPLGQGCFVSDYLSFDDPSFVIPQTQTWMQDNPEYNVEDYIKTRLEQLWKEEALDLVICQYSSIIPFLEKLGIPYRCPFLSDGHLKRIIEKTLMKIELARLHNNHPAVIQILPRQTPSDGLCHAIYQALQQYIAQNLIDCVLQNAKECCTIITSMQILRFLTNDFQICRISAYLRTALDFPVVIGYGVGTNPVHAMNNVQIASKEAKILGHSFLVDTNGSLIGPLDSDNRMVITPNSMPDAGEIAKRCKLSAMTIQKLQKTIQSSGSDKITIPEMAQKLGTTIRNANRIMLNLCRGNIARPVYTQATHSRGRPIQVYILDFGTSQY